MDHPRSLKIAPFDTALTIFYSSLIDAIRLSCTCILVPLLCLSPPMDGFPWDDVPIILREGQRMASVHSGEEILRKGLTP